MSAFWGVFLFALGVAVGLGLALLLRELDDARLRGRHRSSRRRG